MPDNFAEFIERERERLGAERERIFNEQQTLQAQLDAVNREFDAINAYLAAREGRPVEPARRRRPPTSGRRGSKREALVLVIQQNPAGLTRGGILDKLGLKGDKSGEMSVSNALTALTKSGQIIRRDGKYLPA